MDAIDKARKGDLNFLCERCPSLVYHRNSEYGYFALGHAAYAGKFEMMTLIIEAGIKADLEYNHARSTQVVNNEVLPRKALTLRSHDGQTAMHYAQNNNKIESVKLLIEKDLNKELLRIANDVGDTPLHYAVGRRPNIEIAKMLIEADPDFQYSANKQGLTPLLIAIEKAEWRDSPDMLKLILKLQPSQSKVPVGNKGWTALHYAVSDGYLTSVREIIRFCPESSEVVDNKGRNFLHHMVKSGNVKMVTDILGMEEITEEVLNSKDIMGRTPWDVAAKSQNESILCLLVDSRVNLNEDDLKDTLNSVDENGDTILFKAAQDNNSFLYKELYEIYPSLVYHQGKGGHTVLHHAACRGELQMLIVLIEAGDTVSHRAAWRGGELIEMLRKLLYEADPESYTEYAEDDSESEGDEKIPQKKLLTMIDEQGDTALHKAVLNHKLEAVKLLLEADPAYKYDANNSGDTPIMISIREARTNDNKSDTGEIRSLLFQMQPRQTMEHRVENSGTLLHLAASEEDLSCIEDIIKFCPGILDVVDNDGNTPLHKAVLNHQLRAVKLLVEADPDYKYLENKSGYTPIMIAVQQARSNDIMFDSVKIRRLLFEMQPKQTMAHKGENGWTSLLHQATSEEDLSCIQDIIKFCTEYLDVADNDGKNFLHIAAELVKIKVVKMVLNAKDIPSNVFYNLDNDGNTPMHIAEKTGNDLLMGCFLFDHRCSKIMPRGMENGWTKLHQAASDGDIGIIKDIIKWTNYLHLEDNEGKTFLHIAAEFEKVEVVKMILRVKDIPKERVLDKKDNNGNTPFHIAALTGNEPLTRCFLFDPRIEKNTVNAEDQHVLSAIKFPYDKRKAGVHHIAHTVDQSELKDQSEVDLVVGALIATVSFAAGITVPGGYISDGPNQGTAVFSKRLSFTSFIISNTFALVFSLFAVFSHFCARLLSADADIICLLNVAKVCTLAAIYCMMAAFIAGSFAILAKSNLLAIVVCIISCLFFFFGCYPLWLIVKQSKWMNVKQNKCAAPASEQKQVNTIDEQPMEVGDGEAVGVEVVTTI